MSRYYYYQLEGGEETWKPCPVDQRPKLEAEKHPAFFTALAVSQLADDLPVEDQAKLRYSGSLYFDWDLTGGDMAAVAEQVHKLCFDLEAKGLDMDCASLYATGGRGFHLEVPMACFMSKIPKEGIQFLPAIYKEMAFKLAVEWLDFKVYKARRGNMWRTCGVARKNGHYKVPITYTELKEMTVEMYDHLTSAPRILPAPTPPKIALELMVLFDKAQQDIVEKLKKRGKKKPANPALLGRKLPSLDALLAGEGLKPDAGFHNIALQLAVVSDAAKWDEDTLVKKAEGLLAKHVGDGHRYNTPEKRRAELIRMHRYIDGNPCYDFSIAALKSILNHDAPDLEGIPVTAEDIAEEIKAAESGEDKPIPDIAINEFDVAGGIDLTKYGVYVSGEDGTKKRVCALSFANIHILRATATGQVSCYEADILVNGKFVGRQVLELDTFAGLQAFNKMAGRHSHALQGTDAHVRGLMMRIAEKGKKEGKTFFVVSREGLDMVNVTNHEDPEMREPFLVWADAKGVILPPHIAAKPYEFSFQGYPDARGTFRTDINDAPALIEWIADPENKKAMRDMLQNLMTCQTPSFMAKLFGWYTAAFYRMLFHKVYSKFPLLHVNGAAGSGKTELNKLLLSFCFFNQEGKTLTPGSTLFAVQSHAAATSSIPLIVDEYKPHEMGFELHNKFKLMFRDSYNCREVTRGGGTRDNDDYRFLFTTQLAAPIVFIGEAAEEEAAVMERVVLATMVRPPASIAMQWSSRFHLAERGKQALTILGRYMATDIVLNYSVEQLMAEFDPMFAEARETFMLSEKHMKMGLTDDQIRAKQGAKERTVFNYTVTKFGLLKLRQLLSDEDMFGNYFDELFDQFEENVYDRMTDLLSSTMAEWVKVLNRLASMSSSVDANLPVAIRHKKEYLIHEVKGRTVLELAARSCYDRYRMYCKSTNEKPLFPGAPAFLHGLKDAQGFIEINVGSELDVPGGAYVFDLDELTRLGVEPFKER